MHLILLTSVKQSSLCVSRVAKSRDYAAELKACSLASSPIKNNQHPLKSIFDQSPPHSAPTSAKKDMFDDALDPLSLLVAQESLKEATQVDESSSVSSIEPASVHSWAAKRRFHPIIS